jgi:hypothetical protein
MEPVTTVLAVSAAANFLGNLFSGAAQGKVSKQQLELARQQLGLSREQFALEQKKWAFQQQQTLRQNSNEDRNAAQINPLMLQMLGRSQENMGARPNIPQREAPGINNPYSKSPERASGLPWLAGGGAGMGGPPTPAMPGGNPASGPEEMRAFSRGGGMGGSQPPTMPMPSPGLVQPRPNTPPPGVGNGTLPDTTAPPQVDPRQKALEVFMRMQQQRQGNPARFMGDPFGNNPNQMGPYRQHDVNNIGTR